MLTGLAVVVWALFGGIKRLPDRTTAPLLPDSALQRVADLDYPPGQVAVSKSGRVFLTFDPRGAPLMQLAELVGGKPIPWPSAEFQKEEAGTAHFQSVSALRINRQDRLWVLDRGHFVRGPRRLLAFDIESGRLVERYDLPPEVAGLLSSLSDLAVDPAGTKVYVADSSPILQNPAIIVYDAARGSSRRLLESQPSVQGDRYIIKAGGRDMVLFGVYVLRFGVSALALDGEGKWLYYGAVSGDRLYRVRTGDLNDESLSAEALEDKVENYAPKTLGGALRVDPDGNVFLADVEHSAILTSRRDRGLRTLVKGPALRWPSSVALGPDGRLYVSCSALQDVLFRSEGFMRSRAPFQIFSFNPPPDRSSR